MRFVSVETVDFRRSELTNMLELQQRHARLRTLGKNDVVVLKNTKGNQLIFVYGFYAFSQAGMMPARYLRSEKLRLIDMPLKEVKGG